MKYVRLFLILIKINIDIVFTENFNIPFFIEY
jgi:hypothetical protein